MVRVRFSLVTSQICDNKQHMNMCHSSEMMSQTRG
jgi:hypothetical protein